MRGLDYAWTHVPAPLVKVAGFGFVARYLSHDASKNLSKPEADALLAAGVAIVVVWEDTAQGALRGYAGGVADAEAADAQARACGLAGAFIYFAADWDVTPAQQAAVDAYLDGCAQVIGRARTGLYGGFWPCTRAWRALKADKFWGTLAWSGDNWATSGFVPDVMQGAQVTIGGVSVDLDTGDASGDFGQWPRPASTTIPMPPAPVTVPVEEPDMILFNVDQSTVPAGDAWPGVLLLAGDATLHHVTSPADLKAYQGAGLKEATFTYGEFLARGGVPVPAP
jgi:hypothetical protein